MGLRFDRDRRVFVRDPEEQRRSAVIELEQRVQQIANNNTGPWYFNTVQERETWLQSRRRRR